jgi:hypothetical protein
MNSDAESATGQRGSVGSEWFWRILAGVIFVSVLWILWLLWQITPKSNVNPIVFQIYQNRQSSTGVIQPGPGAPQPEAGATAGTEPSAIGTGAPMETLKVETELKLPKPAAPATK